MKIAVNKCFGGFGLSKLAVLRYAELEGFKLTGYRNKRDGTGKLDFNSYERIDQTEAEDNGIDLIHWIKQDLGEIISSEQLNQGTYFSERDINRNDLHLVQVVEELGERASGRFGQIRLVEIPDDVEWEIDEYDGLETVHEKHRSW
jgi:hypothetical protein